MTAWYAGLPCRTCHQRVKQNDSGLFVMPVLARGRLGVPWAECGDCREGAR